VITLETLEITRPDHWQAEQLHSGIGRAGSSGDGAHRLDLYHSDERARRAKGGWLGRDPPPV
jgi:hypothetical protein